jgi:hypothetical protein
MDQNTAADNPASCNVPNKDVLTALLQVLHVLGVAQVARAIYFIRIPSGFMREER